jgi:hypothetical protein
MTSAGCCLRLLLLLLLLLLLSLLLLPLLARLFSLLANGKVVLRVPYLDKRCKGITSSVSALL